MWKLFTKNKVRFGMGEDDGFGTAMDEITEVSREGIDLESL